VIQDTSRSLRLLAVLILLALGIIVFLPVGAVLARSVWVDGHVSLDAYRTILSSARQWGLLRNTLMIAAGATILATLLGAACGWALERFDVPGRKWLAGLLALPLLIPPYVNAIVWADLLGRQGLLRFGLDVTASSVSTALSPYTVAGVILVLSLSYFPIVSLATAAAFRRYDPRVEEPARLAMGGGRVFRSIAFPLIAPSILSGALLVFVLSLVEFAVPSLLQVNVYAVEIYGRFSATYEFAQAAAQAMPLLLCGVAALAAWMLYIRPRQGRLAGRAPRTDRIRKGGGQAWAAAGLCLGIVALAVVLPLAVMVQRSMPAGSYLDVWKTAREEMASSLLLAALSATVLTGLAFAMGLLARARHRSACAYPAALLGFLVSGPLLGIGLILVWNRPAPFALVYDTPIVLVLACAARFLFFAYCAIDAALRDLPLRLDEAAAVAGVPWRRRAGTILLPLVSPALFGVWGLAFVLSLRELDAAVLVTPPGWTPLSVRLFSLMHYGPGRLVAALSVVTVMLVMAAAAMTALMYLKARKLIDARR